MEQIIYPKKERMIKVRVNTTVTEEMYKKVIEVQKEFPLVTFAECMRVGIGVCLSELGDEDYESNINVLRKKKELARKFAELQEVLSKHNTQ